MIFKVKFQNWEYFFGTPSISLSLWPELFPVLLKFHTGDSIKIKTIEVLIKIKSD